MKAIVLENGHPNWDVMKPSADTTDTEETPTESAPIRIKLQKLSIKDLSVSYDDRQGGMYAAINHLNATCSGDFGSERTTVDLSMETPSLTYRTGGIPFLNKARLEADMNVDADFANNKYTLKDNTISLNAIQVNIDGWAAMQKNGIGMDMKLNTNEVGFKELLSLIPAIYAKDFQDLKTDGKASLTAFAKGILGQDQVPQFEVALDVKDGMFRYPSLPAGVENINITANVKNAGGNIDATEITVSPFDFVLAGNPFSLKASVKTPVSDPDLQASAQGTLDLGKIKEVYPLEDMTLNGTIQADMNLAGKLSYIEKEQYDQMKAAGSIRLNNMKLNLQDMPAIDIQRSTFSFSPRYLQLSETTINIGQNDLTVDSRFENYLGYALKGSTLKGNLNISSNHIHVNDFISSDTTTVQAPETHDSTTVSSSSRRYPYSGKHRLHHAGKPERSFVRQDETGNGKRCTDRKKRYRRHAQPFFQHHGRKHYGKRCLLSPQRSTTAPERRIRHERHRIRPSIRRTGTGTTTGTYLFRTERQLLGQLENKHAT